MVWKGGYFVILSKAEKLFALLAGGLVSEGRLSDLKSTYARTRPVVTTFWTWLLESAFSCSKRSEELRHLT